MLVATFGSDALAGYTIGIRMIIFALLPSFGMSNAAATLVGQNLGAGKPDRAETSVWRTALFNMAFLGVVGAIFLLFAPLLVSVFTSNPAVVPYAVRCLRIVSVGSKPVRDEPAARNTASDQRSSEDNRVWR